MEFNVNAWLRPNVLRMKPYSSARDEFSGSEGIFLDANENSLGSVGIVENYNRYPDPLQKNLKLKLAQIENIPPNWIFLGNGSDEAIDLVIRAFCEPAQDQVIILPPTYGMYQVSAHLNNVGVLEVPLLPNFQLDVDRIIASFNPQTKILFICSPNNPSGNLMHQGDLEKVIQNFPGIVLLDEAYVDFAPGFSMISALKEYPNLIIIKTFSKAWGLAGLRLGMAFAQPEIIRVFNKIKPPYNINLLTQEVALKALEKPEIKAQMLEEIFSERLFLEEQLYKQKEVLKIFPSNTNFLLVQFREADRMYDYLVSKQIIVRNRSKVLYCEGCLRITVGTHSENLALLEAIEAYT